MSSRPKIASRRCGDKRRKYNNERKTQSRGAGGIVSLIRSLRNGPIRNDVARWLAQLEALTPDQHRIALTNLIMTLSEDHLERIVQEIMPELRKDIVTTLPEPASLAVLNSLTPDQLLRVGSVSREWQFIASSNSVWQEKCHEIGIQQLPPDIASNRPLAWKEAYLVHHMIPVRTWAKSRPASMWEVPCHDNAVVIFMERAGNRLITVGEDHTVQFFDFDNGDLVNTFRSPCPLLTLKIEGNVAVTAGSNGNVFILNSNDGQLIDTLTEDFATSQGLELLRNRLVVSSTDGTIYVWDVVTRQYVYTENRGTMVKLLAANDQIIATGDSQGTVTISYPNQPQRPARTINAHRGPVAGLIVFNGYILTISTDLKCCLWDSETLQQSHELQLPSWIRLEDPARPGVPTFSVHGNLILLVSDRRFCLWNPRDGKVVHDFKGHLESIRDVKFNSHSVVSSSADGYVKLWNRPTGNFIYDLIWPEHVERRTRHLPGFDTCYRIYVDDRKLVVSGHRQRRTCLLFVNFVPPPEVFQRQSFLLEDIDEKEDELEVLEFGQPRM
ncbi:F-box/WD repeat-containing protein 7-like isoform X2 [Varroa jacobsoni]|uniref:F-box/WD repeat-containing protein 7-like isoform X2 n=1 Tax=Varroa jacobsoni TaxID=62625 RepID=UPI000BF28989|nr:F-box/WD repeat-containing protein 7-like isoform X2 [Varroa jacobsoni]